MPSYYIGNIRCGSELYHFGVKGMKWGVRRYVNKDGTLTPLGREHYGLSGKKTYNQSFSDKQIIKTKSRSGKDIVLEQLTAGRFTRLLASGSKKITQNVLNTKCFEIKVDGKKVGDIQMYQESETSVNGVWLGINDKERGQGYATAVLGAMLDDLRARGYSQMTLEVPGNSPDARHIYESFGFIAGKQISDSTDVWGGLTAMKLDLKKK